MNDDDTDRRKDTDLHVNNTRTVISLEHETYFFSSQISRTALQKGERSVSILLSLCKYYMWEMSEENIRHIRDIDADAVQGRGRGTNKHIYEYTSNTTFSGKQLYRNERTECRVTWRSLSLSLPHNMWEMWENIKHISAEWGIVNGSDTGRWKHR